MNALLEILTTKYFMIVPEVAHGFRATIERNIAGHIPYEGKPKLIASKLMRGMGEQEYSVVASWMSDKISASGIGIVMRGEPGESGAGPDEDANRYVAVLHVEGPITRDGDACSYGSRDFRNIMMQVSKQRECDGIVFYINTPGGSAWAINDFKQGIEFARGKGKPVIAFVDGQCCSAGMYLASQCDERYYMHEKDEIGCIGVMAAFYTQKDGEKNAYTNETYHELYDPESFDKNAEWRAVANENDTKLMVDRLTELGVEFRNDVKAACPKAKDEHLHGKVFDAADVDGILMDGKRTFQEVLQRVSQLSDEQRKKKGENDGANAMRRGVKNSKVQTQKIENMDKKYLTVAQLCGVTELGVSEEGTFLNDALVDVLNKNVGVLHEQIANLTKERDALKENQKSVADLQAQLDEVNKQLEQAKAEKAGIDEKLVAANKTIDERDATIAENAQSIKDLQAQVTELTTKPNEEPAAGASPANNGGGVEQPHMAASIPAYDPNLSPKENRKRMDAALKKIKEDAAKKTVL